MDDDQISQIVAEFISITGIVADQARFFVDSCGGNLESALSTYYETIGTTNAGAPNVPSLPSASIASQGPTTAVSNPSSGAPAPKGPTTLSGQAADEMPAEWKKTTTSQNSSTRNPPRAGGIKTFGDLSGDSAPSTSSRIRGVSTLKDITSASVMPGSGEMSEDDEDEDDGPTDLYAGGSRSGINVQDPIQQQNTSGKPGGIVADILKKAKEAGSAPPPPSANANTSKAAPYFRGPAQTLGSDLVASRPIPPSPVAGPARRKAFRSAVPVPRHFGSDLDDDNDDDENENENDEEVEKHLTFWKNGFSIEDGPLMSYEDPKNKDILDAINHGRAPLDLLGVRLNQRVMMRVRKRLTENYIPPPKPPAKPFEGTGNRLGSPLPAVIAHSKGHATSSSQTAAAPTPLSQTSSAQPTMIFEVDNNLPVTSVQIRLSDGSRMVTRFNHSHTVGDIRRQIASSNPSLASRPYALQTTFPSRDLTDDNQSIKDAGILGAVVVQRYT